MIIRFGDIGKSLGTRDDGRRFRMQIVNGFNEQKKVELDFHGVEMVSNSFADECIGKLVEEMGLEKLKSFTTFKNTSKNVAMVLQKVIKDRLASVC